MNDTSHWYTSYISRVIALPPDVAQQVFDACRADRQFRSPTPLRWSVPSGPGVVLVLDGACDAILPWTLRSCPGVLRTGRFGRGLDVELELTAWSETRTELGIRLTKAGWNGPGHRYSEAAGGVADSLASELELRGLLALHPDHDAGVAVVASAWL